MRSALLFLAVALALPGSALAGDVTMVSRDIPLGGRTLQSPPPPMRFNMLGVHWQGPGEVRYRTRALGGGWAAWRVADADLAPDARTGEMGRPGWRDGNLGNLDWTGASDRVQFRTSGRVERLRAFYLWSKPRRPLLRTTSVADSPTIVPRSSWLADEKIVRATARLAPAVKLAIVHHTATSNSYTPAQAAAIVRGIQVYHVKANGWNDVGYNFFVDRFGTVYEGRGGGADRNVVGAHSAGFNTGSVGVALIGNHSNVAPTRAAQSALVGLLAWRLDVAHADPLASSTVTSLGNRKFKAGRSVTLRTISGHLDTGPSECPGRRTYALLPALAKRVAATGLPKLYGGSPTGTLGGAVRFEARLSSARPWSVTVATSTGKVVATGSGRSAKVDWTWSSKGAGRGPFTWTVAAGDSVLPATGTLSNAPPPKQVPPPKPTPAPTPAPSILSGVTVTPSTVAPGASGAATTATVGLALAKPAFVTVRVTNTAGTRTLVTVVSTTVPAGSSTFGFDAGALGDGRYRVVVAARPAGGVETSKTVDLVVVRLLTGLVASPAVFSPNGDAIADAVTIGFTLAQPASVQVVAQRAGVTAASVYSGQLGAGSHSIGWDGSAFGARLPDGEVVLVVTATNALGAVSLLTTVWIEGTAAPPPAAAAPAPETPQ